MNLIKNYKNAQQIILFDRFLLKNKSLEIKVNRVSKYRKSATIVNNQQQSTLFVDR